MTEATATAPAAPAAPAAPKDERNGVTRPAGALTGAVWSIAETAMKEASAAAGGVLTAPARSVVFERCAAANINPATTATQWGLFRKYHGITGTSPRTPDPDKEAKKAQAAAEKAAAKALKDAEKAEKKAIADKARAEKKAASDADKAAKAAAKAAAAAAPPPPPAA